PPSVQRADWPRNPVDHFTLARMEAAGLTPATAADPTTLVRRVYLDLIGLPPLPEEVDAFLADAAFSSLDDAYSRLVDRLLASPHYGERWARAWLDLARYADTNGYEKDRERQIWAYRDWVIAAINRDLPFDQFTVEQLAGDLLPEATRAQQVATGFHRNTLLNEEGGIDPLEFRFYALCDRVATTGTTWLGLTLQCCQCHHHKYDPIAQSEYYGVMALLNNADDVELPLGDEAAEASYAANLANAEQLLSVLPAAWPLSDDATNDLDAQRQRRETLVADRFAVWLQEQRERVVAWRSLEPVEYSSNEPLLQLEDDDSIFVSGDITKHDTYQLRLRGDLRGATAIRIEALPDERLPGNGPGLTYYEGTRGDFFLSELQVVANGQPVKFSGASQSFSGNQFGENPVTADLAVDGDFQTGWAIYGRIGERHTAVFTLAEPLQDAAELQVALHFGRHFASSLGRFRISVTSSPHAVAMDLPADVEALLLQPDDTLTSSNRERLQREFLLAAPELAKQAQEIRELLKRPPASHTLVLRERPEGKGRTTHLYARGEYLRASAEVAPGTPLSLPPFPDDQPRNRLGLARWLTSPNHPLTARVTVNRHWAALFGVGIVPTTEDFGVQGAPPTDPALLDWLAVEFVEKGWSLKGLHRLLVTSSTYRQTSQVSAESLAADPLNTYLTRAARKRLDAELIHDAALRASGLLSAKLGGPGVRPPQPVGVTEVAYGNPSWTASTGEDRYRRGIYTLIKRTAPFAVFQTFDATNGTACTARRDVSNTPLQALALLNDVIFQEAAQNLGRVLAERHQSDDVRIGEAMRRVVSRPPTDAERNDLAAFLAAQRQRFAEGELDAAQIAGGQLEGVAHEQIVEQAVWTTLARVLLCLDEAITRN
ncbi:MAG: DUF1549 and DUF1553 domain-containing protein, partial [Planctomycetia bacterium]|nr:DUF1549 and DUF1553 domain-containing protein [Planctomycetia bacterium]